jgi:diguanylate cyclase (GGDEF)-like protein
VAQAFQEKINILTAENSQELKNKVSLQEKIGRYGRLKNIIEEINQELTLNSIADSLVSISFSLISDNKGACILYLVDRQAQIGLSLFKTKKEDKKLIIKAKEGDIFDLWVLRRTSPLLIEDVKKDFRFDLDKLNLRDSRVLSSLISAPLMSEHRFLGILRLDSYLPNFYTQDDLRFLVTICDIGAVALENGELFQRTQDLAIHDSLTSLFTKGYFLERLKEEYRRSTRHNAVFSLLMLDIDYFKNYNDKFGHTAGDLVLKDLSQIALGSLKKFSPLVSRFGGEEFCIILPRTDKQQAKKIAEELREKIEKTEMVLRRQKTKITVSIGVASFPADARDEEELIFKADRAMYEAKQKGRNCVCCI